LACAPPDRGPRWERAGAKEPHGGGTLHIAHKDAIRTLDPAFAYDEQSIMALHMVVDTLVDYEPGGVGWVPRLAERWEVSADGLTYLFHLRSGAKYADGRPIVAADIAFSLERALKLPDSPYAANLAGIVGAQDVIDGKAERAAGIEVKSERELELRLVDPSPAFPAVFAMPFTSPLRREHVEAMGGQLRRHPLSSGPYQVDGWSEGLSLELVRNPHYGDRTRGRVDKIILRENLPRDTQFLMFERGELDAVDKLAAPDLHWVRSQAAWAPYVKSIPLLTTFGSRFNVTLRPFDDVRVRRAFNYALNRATIRRLLTGTATPAHGLLPPGTLGHDASLQPYPHDPARARALLAEAGHGGGLQVEYMTTADEEAQKLAEALQSDLAAVGVEMRISVVAVNAWVTAIGEREDNPPFSLIGWQGDSPDPTSFFDVKFHSRSISDLNSQNDSYYANPALDRLLDDARKERDPARRADMYRRVERILYDDVPWMFGYHQVQTEVIQPYVQNYAPHPIWLRDYTTVWLDLGPDGEPVRR
jgi:ABC-type transport system substrate-binding protein